MTNRDLNLAMRISADVTRLMGGLAKGEGGLRKFGSAAKQEMAALGRFAGSMEGKLAQLGLGISAVATAVQSAHLDKELKQLQLTAGATAKQADQLRKSWFDAQVATGQGVDELKSGSDALVAAGLSIADAQAAVLPMAETMAVAKTNATLLGQAMGVAGKQFNIDLSNTAEAALLLDKMVVAGRLGNAELENLPDIFARIGGNAKAAGLDINQTLALTETLSAFEPNAERLATLTDSTLRVFTNDKYRQAAQKATGVKFYNKDKSQRDPFKVIEDIKSKYDKMTSDLGRNNFISAAFGTADMDTIKGIRSLLADGSMGALASKLKGIEGAGGTVKRDLSDAIDNAVDQTGRLKGALREAGDGLAKPINDAFAQLVKHGLDAKKDGGLGLSGDDLLLGGAGLAVGTAVATRYGGKAIKGLAGKFGGVGVGVATGKALEEAAGVTPVFVVNMPDRLGGAVGPADLLSGKTSVKGVGKWIGRAGVPLMLAASGMEAYNLATDDTLSSRDKTVGYAGVAGGAAGAWAGAAAGAAMGSVVPVVGTAIGGLAGGALGYWGGESLSRAIAEAFVSAPPPPPAELTGTISVLINSEAGPAKVTELVMKGGPMLNVLTGQTAAGRG